MSGTTATILRSWEDNHKDRKWETCRQRGGDGPADTCTSSPAAASPALRDLSQPASLLKPHTQVSR